MDVTIKYKGKYLIVTSIFRRMTYGSGQIEVMCVSACSTGYSPCRHSAGLRAFVDATK